MNCERCGKPYRYYGPWYEPPENHYYRCDPCNRTVYPYEPEIEEEEER